MRKAHLDLDSLGWAADRNVHAEYGFTAQAVHLADQLLTGGVVSDVDVPRPGPHSEPPWVWWRLGLLVSNPGGVGLLGSVERCFELGRRDVVAVAVEAVLVEPVHP